MKKFLLAAFAGLLALTAMTGSSAVRAEDAAAMNYTLSTGGQLVVEDGKAYMVDEAGTKTPAADGDYATTDGHTVTVKDGAASVAGESHDGEAHDGESMPE